MADFPSWQQGLRRTYEPLRGLHRADVVIVGGGLTGITAAAILSCEGLKVVVLEARQLGVGATWGCLGIASYQAEQAYQIASTSVNTEAAKVYAQMMLSTMDDLRAFLRRHAMDCQARETDLYTYAFLERDVPALHALVAAQQALGLPVELAPDAGGCPFPVEICAVTHRQITLSPLLYLMDMARLAERSGCLIAEGTPVQAIDSGGVQFQGGKVLAPVILMATGTPAGCTQQPLLSMLHTRVQVCRTLSGSIPVHEAFHSVRDGGLQLRPLAGGLLCSWTLGRAGEAYGERMALLERVLQGRLPDYVSLREHIRQDVWSRDGLPLIGNLHTRQSHLLMATGYNGIGLVGSFLAAQIIRRQLLGSSLPEDSLFQPHRVYKGRRQVMLGGLKPMVMAQLKGRLRRRAPRCPHMGCRMRYSPIARRWECPCHGSSFSILGENLDAPALHPAQVSAKDRM